MESPRTRRHVRDNDYEAQADEAAPAQTARIVVSRDRGSGEVRASARRAEMAGEEPGRAVALVLRLPGGLQCHSFDTKASKNATPDVRSNSSSSQGIRYSTGTVIFLAASIRASYTNTPPRLRAATRDSTAVNISPVTTPTTRRRSRSALDADLGQRLQGIQGRLPFRHRTLRQRHVVVDDDRGDRLARRPGLMDRLGPLLILTVSRPVTMPGRVDRF